MTSDSVTTFDDLAKAGYLEIGDGYRTKQAEHGRPGLPILRVAEVLDGRIAPKFEDFVSESYRSTMGPKVSRADDIVLTTKGTVGRVAVIPPGCPEFVYSPQVCFFRTSSDSPLTNRYLYYWFKSELFWSQARSLKGQTDMADYLNLADIRSLRIVLPTEPVQRAIGEVLGSLDRKIAANERIVDTASGLMKLMYAEAIVEGAIITSIAEIADVVDGPHATPEKLKSGPWFLSISSLRNGRLALAESAHVKEADFQRWTRRVTPRFGDVLFSYETRLGEAALMPSGVRACLGRRMALLRPRSGSVGPRTLLYTFLSRSFQDTIRRRSIHGATVDRIPLTDLPAWPIELPATETQHLEDALSCLDDLASNGERENEALVSLRDALLPRLMSGEIRVRDAETIAVGAT